MDSHIVGPRGKNGYGSIQTVSGKRIAFGDAAQTGLEIMRTAGASVESPLLLKFTGLIPTAFDGTSPAFSLVETDLDGTGAVTIANIAAFSSGAFAASKVLIVDKIYKLVYTPATGSPTAGIGTYVIELSGLGQLSITI